MIVEVPEDEREVVGPLVIDLMRHAADLDVPTTTPWGTTCSRSKSGSEPGGSPWADAKS